MGIKEFERVFKALANKRRLAILKYLKKQMEASVAEIATEIRLSFKATSKHLNILAGIDMLEKEQRSLNMFYRLSSSQRSIVQRILSYL